MGAAGLRFDRHVASNDLRLQFRRAAKNLIASVNPPLSANPDSLYYDDLGNVVGNRSELLFKSTYSVDDIGRTTGSVAPIIFGDSITSYTKYNILDEAFESGSAGKTSHSLPTDSLIVTQTFDPEGRPVAVTRHAVPNTAGIVSQITKFRYDNIGRKLKEIPPNLSNGTPQDSSAITWWSDAAGNDTLNMTRRGYAIRTSYDLLGRVTQRVIPATTPSSLSINFPYMGTSSWTYPRSRNTKHHLWLFLPTR